MTDRADTGVRPIITACRRTWIVTYWTVSCPEHGRVGGSNIQEWIDHYWDDHLAEHHGDTR